MQAIIYGVSDTESESFFQRRFFAKRKICRQKEISEETDDISKRVVNIQPKFRLRSDELLEQVIYTIVNGCGNDPNATPTEKLHKFLIRYYFLNDTIHICNYRKNIIFLVNLTTFASNKRQ